ncbi:rRNA maturation RNase YbeY [Gloeothece citriformis]|uniref:rRNA maturation RNase YbeY n=1 Tax=Gloeothece citriformis TaxID=2546356 RepID=UPI00059E3A58|nr:rRNA maturation RNase YbeY [Gloeothece citriformis]
MTFLKHSTLTLDLNLQDVYFCNTSTEETPTAPISSETWQSWFQTWLDILLPTLKSADSCELSLRLTDDQEIQFYNAQYRHKNQPTDVLAFAALEVDVPNLINESFDEPLYLGDIIISIDTAKRQATEQGHSLTQELAWLAAHGFLHLLGWDHPDDESLSAMLAQQETLLNNIGLLPQN